MINPAAKPILAFGSIIHKIIVPIRPGNMLITTSWTHSIMVITIIKFNLSSVLYWDYGNIDLKEKKEPPGKAPELESGDIRLLVAGPGGSTKNYNFKTSSTKLR